MITSYVTQAIVNGKKLKYNDGNNSSKTFHFALIIKL